MRRSLNLGKILGIPIKLHSSWFLVALLLTFSLGGSYFPQRYPAWSELAYWAVGAITAIFLFVSVLLHELGHSVLALRERVPVKSITLFFFGGVAQIEREPPTAGAEFRIAIAGPLTSLGLAGLFAVSGELLANYSTLAGPLAYLSRINLTLALFNMIPGVPLDGGRVLRAALWGLGGSMRSATRWAATLGRAVGYAFIAIGIAQFFLAGSPGGLWLVFIGWFLNNAARANYQQVALRASLSGIKARSVMAQQCALVPDDLRLTNLIEDYVLAGGYNCFFVTDHGNVKGVITLDNIRAASRGSRQALTAQQVMTPIDTPLRADPDEDMADLLQRMNDDNVSQVPIVENGSLLGVVTRQGLLEYLQLRNDLGTAAAR
jgi:Zn-dependent protease/predicted transcriptional regulator